MWHFLAYFIDMCRWHHMFWWVYQKRRLFCHLYFLLWERLVQGWILLLCMISCLKRVTRTKKALKMRWARAICYLFCFLSYGLVNLSTLKEDLYPFRFQIDLLTSNRSRCNRASCRVWSCCKFDSHSPVYETCQILCRVCMFQGACLWGWPCSFPTPQICGTIRYVDQVQPEFRPLTLFL